MMNWPTIILAAVIAAALIAIVIHAIMRKKQGKSSCACGCANCAMRDSCHEKS